MSIFCVSCFSKRFSFVSLVDDTKFLFCTGTKIRDKIRLYISHNGGIQKGRNPFTPFVPLYLSVKMWHTCARVSCVRLDTGIKDYKWHSIIFRSVSSTARFIRALTLPSSVVTMARQGETIFNYFVQ